MRIAPPWSFCTIAFLLTTTLEIYTHHRHNGLALGIIILGPERHDRREHNSCRSGTNTARAKVQRPRNCQVHGTNSIRVWQRALGRVPKTIALVPSRREPTEATSGGSRNHIRVTLALALGARRTSETPRGRRVGFSGSIPISLTPSPSRSSRRPCRAATLSTPPFTASRPAASGTPSTARAPSAPAPSTGTISSFVCALVP